MADETAYKMGNIDVYKYEMPVIASNMYVLLSGDKAMMVDPHTNTAVTEMLQKRNIKDIFVVLTHEHYDHISGVNYYREHFQCTVYGNQSCADATTKPEKNMSAFYMSMFIDRTNEEQRIAAETLDERYSCSVDVSFEKEMELEWEGLKLRFLSTPGHSMGSICVTVDDKYIFTGDSLVQGNKIITRLPGGSKSLYKEITKPFLEGLDKNMVVFPGHGEISRLGELFIA